MTTLDEEVMTHLVEDLDPPCDYSVHHIHGSGPVVWIVTYRDPFVCGCRPKQNPALYCEGCWTARTSVPEVFCRECFTTWSASADILKVERR